MRSKQTQQLKVFGFGLARAVARTLVAVILVHGTLPPPAWGQEVEWIRQFGSANTDSAQAVSADASGVYVAAQAGLGLAIPQGNLLKYDTHGNRLWSREPVARDTYASGVVASASGVYLVGSTNGALPGHTRLGPTDAFVVKYDADGNELWTRQFGSTTGTGASGIAADDSGIYVVGSVIGTLPGQAISGWVDAFVRKYDHSGTEQWTRQFGTTDFDSALAIWVGAAGAYVAGYTEATLPGQVRAGGIDAFVRKYDTNGNELWTRQFGSTDSDIAFGIVADSSGVYVGGQVNATLPGQASPGSPDGFVRKYDHAGNELWTRQLGSSGFDYVGGVSADLAGLYVTGGVEGSFPGQTGAGGEDTFLRKYDADGNELWTIQFGSPELDNPSGVVAAAHGLYLVGLTYGALPGETSRGGSDGFVAKIQGEDINQEPVADAGSDQILECAALSGTPVTLDGSASSDPEDNALTYTWTGPFVEGNGSVTGVSPTVTLPLGTHSITLTVDDGNGGTATDTVQVAVILHVAGLFPPLASLVPEGDAVLYPDRAIRLGRPLPLRLTLSCGGLAVTEANVPPPRLAGLSRKGEALDLSTLDLDMGESNDGGAMFRYADGDWVFNLNTRGLGAGTYVVTIETPDGRRYTAGVVLR